MVNLCRLNSEIYGLISVKISSVNKSERIRSQVCFESDNDEVFEELRGKVRFDNTAHKDYYQIRWSGEKFSKN